MEPTKLEHFRNLVSLAAADGEIKVVERIALSKIAFDRGIPLDRVNVMFQKAGEYQYIIPQNQQEKLKQLEEMVEVALVDGEFAKAELELIKMVAEKLDVSNEELTKILESHSIYKK